MKVTDDDICNMDVEIKAKSEIMKRNRNYKKVDKKIWRALNMESLQSSISTIRLLKDCFRRYLVFGNYFFDQLKHTFLANFYACNGKPFFRLAETTSFIYRCIPGTKSWFLHTIGNM